jgi:hypothetical protein
MNRINTDKNQGKFVVYLYPSNVQRMHSTPIVPTGAATEKPSNNLSGKIPERLLSKL